MERTYLLVQKGDLDWSPSRSSISLLGAQDWATVTLLFLYAHSKTLPLLVLHSQTLAESLATRDYPLLWLTWSHHAGRTRVSSLINAHSTWVPVLNNALQQWPSLEVWTNMWSHWICSERNRWCGCVHPWCDTPSRCIELEPSWRSYSSTGVISLCSFSLDCRFVCWSEGMSVNTERHLYSKKVSENDNLYFSHCLVAKHFINN